MKRHSNVDGFLGEAEQWKEEIGKIRSVILSTKMDESIKWGLPCYQHEGKNIAILQPFKNYLALMFFKGALLKDTKKLLVDNGPNSKSARRLEFRSIGDAKKLAPVVKAYLLEAMKNEAAGKKVETKAKATKTPAELTAAFKKNAKLKKAFEALTPGRQRMYLMHFAEAKQAATREARVAKWAPHILKGKGFHDR